jgi:antitoxin FitA
LSAYQPRGSIDLSIGQGNTPEGQGHGAVIVRDLDPAIVEKLKARAADHGRSLQAELKAILEAQASQATKAEARALATSIRQRIGLRPQTDSGMLQAEDRER